MTKELEMEEVVRAALVEQMRIVHHAVNSGTMDKDTINGALAEMHKVLYSEAAPAVAAADPEPDVDTALEEDVGDGGEYVQEGDDHTTHGRRGRRRK